LDGYFHSNQKTRSWDLEKQSKLVCYRHPLNWKPFTYSKLEQDVSKLVQNGDGGMPHS
jgi:hypothetical protein